MRYLFLLLCFHSFLSPCFSASDDVGLIAYFSGNCPDGWTSYTGSQGRFIMSTGTYNGITYSVGSIGGEDKVHLTTDNLPRHDHSKGNWRYILQVTGKGTAKGSDDSPVEPDIMVPQPLVSVGNDVPHNNVPQYIALNACQKIKNSFVLAADQTLTNTQMKSDISNLQTAIANLQSQMADMKTYYNKQVTDLKFLSMIGVIFGCLSLFIMILCMLLFLYYKFCQKVEKVELLQDRRTEIGPLANVKYFYK